MATIVVWRLFSLGGRGARLEHYGGGGDGRLQAIVNDAAGDNQAHKSFSVVKSDCRSC